MKTVTFTVRSTSSDAVDKEIQRQLARYESIDYSLEVKSGFFQTEVTIVMRDVK